MKGAPKGTTPTPVKKLYLLRADDVEYLEPSLEDETQIAYIHLKRGGRIVQIDDNADGRGVLTANIRRIVGDKATTRLLSGVGKPTQD